MSITLPLWLLFLAFVLVYGEDLYKILGISRKATQAEIKKAYRQKAKETHPDKNPNVDPDVAAEQFRKIADAYETLSDETSRRQYDEGRKNSNDRTNQRRGNDGWNSWDSWFWDFYGHQRQQARRQQPRRGHRYLHDHRLRVQIKDAQSRLLSITGLTHLKSICLDESDRVEKFVVLAIYDSSVSDCELALNLDILFPFPFAGYTNEGSTGSVWWDELLLAAKFDLHRASPQNAQRMLTHFKFVSHKDEASRYRMTKDQCPTIVFLKRHGNIFDFEKQVVHSHEAYQEFVWQRLKMTLRFINRSDYRVKGWYVNRRRGSESDGRLCRWLDGYRGVDVATLDPGDVYATDTYLSHSFYFRVEHVDGHVLTNEVRTLPGRHYCRLTTVSAECALVVHRLIHE